MYYAVIMAGGTGTRLWPLSRKEQPKQALKLIGDRTMFQHAVDRLALLFPPERICVVTNVALAEVLRAQTPALPAENFFLEPAGRNSAPAAGLAAIHLLRRDPDAIMVMLTADHYILDTGQFRAALAAAGKVAADGTIVTLGIRPTYPAAGFGYIEQGVAQVIVDGFRVYRSAGFAEKPDQGTAIRFVEDGRHTWNSGMFIWRADRLMAEYAAQLPGLHAALMRIADAADSPSAQYVLNDEWSRVVSVSLDYGIMERAENVSVIPVDFGWSDIGNWSALMAVLPGDQEGNVLHAPALLIDSHNCFVRGTARLVAAVGLEDMIIVDTPDVLLVCPRSRSEEVRTLVTHLEADGKEKYL
ncbi:MAG: mannose-1-phosphate guanylyltransferase [Chloroflexi bacterium HGW-Chloroflexi-1]|nr:MAG: mannose-1-phosphate guanylyltransferase [Chloroflexi bacterium HGW-Chloroflexi-1]